MSKRALSQAELEYLAEHIWDIDENDTDNRVDNDSDLSEENVEEENVDSFSEQELSDEESVEDSPPGLIYANACLQKDDNPAD
ncbi:hypothetical protein FQR65_LT20603 [Abscondita terminalis]|nr:hypothetical protein FQR65_LT20603 [Abscondita terminalis]